MKVKKSEAELAKEMQRMREDSIKFKEEMRQRAEAAKVKRLEDKVRATFRNTREFVKVDFANVDF